MLPARSSASMAMSNTSDRPCCTDRLGALPPIPRPRGSRAYPGRDGAADRPLARPPPHRAARPHVRPTREGDTSMSNKGKVIITCAITGAIHTPSMSPHLPVTPDEIADAALGAAEAGAAIVHLHARNPQTGRPDQSPEAFAKFLPRIKQRSNVVINLTSGGAATMTVAERLAPAHQLKPEVASLNMG